MITPGTGQLTCWLTCTPLSSPAWSSPTRRTIRGLRRLVIAAFVPSVINELAGTISMITNRLLDDHGESLDLAADLAQPLPIAVLGQLLGVSISDAEGVQLKQWCDDFLLPFGRDIRTLSADELARTRSAAVGLHGFVDTILSRRTAIDTDDVVGRLLAGESQDRLTEQELFANIVLLLIAGHEKLTSLIGNGAALLLEFQKSAQSWRETRPAGLQRSRSSSAWWARTSSSGARLGRMSPSANK
jgi:cytochrome P450